MRRVAAIGALRAEQARPSPRAYFTREQKWLRREARACGAGDPKLAGRLVRQAMERLGELDARRFGAGDGEYLRGLLRAEMWRERTGP